MSALLAYSVREKAALRRPPSFDRRSQYRYIRQVRGKTGTWVWQARVWFDLVVQHVHRSLDREERWPRRRGPVPRPAAPSLPSLVVGGE